MTFFQRYLSNIQKQNIGPIVAFYTETQELKSGQKQKYFSYHICYENLAKVSKVNKQTDRTKQYASKEESIKTLNKVGTFTQDFKD